MSALRGGRSRKPYSRPNVNEQWVHDKAPGVKNNLNNSESRPRIPSDVATSNTKLLVSNLHYEITPKDLAAIFGQIGTLVREPLIRYDRSGRSSGTAIISYDTAAEATKAKKQFDGLLAKGQPMSITYDTAPQRALRRSVSAPGSSLINRIQRPPLKDRLTSDDSDIKDSDGPGPVRSRPSRGRRGGPKKPASRPEPKKPKTAEELDKELDAFMGDSEAPTANGSTVDAPQAADTTGKAAEDVEMA